MIAPVTCETSSTRTAAKRICISYELCLRLIKEKRLHAVWVGNKFLVPNTAISDFLSGQECGA